MMNWRTVALCILLIVLIVTLELSPAGKKYRKEHTTGYVSVVSTTVIGNEIVTTYEIYNSQRANTYYTKSRIKEAE